MHVLLFLHERKIKMSKKVKVTICTNDPVIYEILDKEESSELFGEDYIEEYGVEIPEDMLSQYKKTHREFGAIQDKIREIIK